MQDKIKKFLTAFREIFSLKATLALVIFIASVFVIASSIGAGGKKTETSNESLQSVHIDVERVLGSDLPSVQTSTKTEKIKRVDTSDWRLTLVNPWNFIPENWEVETVNIKGGLAVDKRCYPELQKMMNACREAGFSPVVCSAYRTQEFQQELFDERVDELLQQGYSQQDAEKKAAESVAVPGTSEHQLGLAVDIVDETYQYVNSEQEKTNVQQWMIANSWRYGFILRYPNGKSDITGIIYEPWHYRYVGEEAAEEIHNLGICLEEYLEL